MNPLFEALAQTWPARMVKGAVEAAAHPGNVYAGRADPMDVGKAFDLAGLSGTGGLGGLGGMAAPSEMALGSALTRQARNLDELRAALAKEHPRADYWVSERANGPVVVDKVAIPPELRGAGEGTRFMKDVLDYADAQGKPVALSPSRDFGSNLAKLEAWYRALGFSPNKGRMKDFSISETMVRPPRT